MKDPDYELPPEVLDGLEQMALRKPKAAPALREFARTLRLARAEWLDGQYPDYGTALNALSSAERSLPLEVFPMNRRAIIAGLPLAALAACTPGTTPTVTPASVVAQGQAIAAALSRALPQIALLPAVARDPKAVAGIVKVEGVVSQAQASLAVLAANLPTAQAGATALSQVWGWLNAAVAVAEAIPGLPDALKTDVVSAGLGLIVLEQFVNATLGTQLSSVKPAA